MIHHVFVSYSRLDSAFVEAVVELLEERGLAVWIDRRDILVSFPWLLDVQDAIAAADLVVTFGSPNQAASQACALEEAATEDLRKRALEVPVGGDPGDVARRIATEAFATTPHDRFRTEALARARSWDRQGRPRSLLPTGRLRRQLDRAARGGSLPVVRRYLAAARNRNRRRKALAALGLLTISFAMTAIDSLQKAGENSHREIAAGERAFVRNRERHYVVETDIYEALGSLGDAASRGQRDYLILDPLWAALNVKVPDLSVRVGGSPPVAFEWVSSGHRAVVVAADGERAAIDWVRARISGTGAAPVPDPAGSSTSGEVTARSIGAGGLVEVRRQSELLTRVWADQHATVLAVSPDGRLLAVGLGADVGIFEVETGGELDRLRGSRGVVRALRWSPDGSRIWAIAGESRVSSWLWRRAHLFADEPGQEFLALSPPGKEGRLVAVSITGEISVASIAGGPVRRFATSTREAVSAAFAGDLVAISGEEAVVLYDLASGDQHRHPLGCLASGLVFSADRSQLHVACDSELRSYDLPSMRQRRRTPIVGGPLRLATLPSGEVLVGTSAGAVSSVSSSGEVTEIENVTQPGTAIFALAASRDGQRVAAAGLGAGRPSSVFSGWPDGDGWNWDNVLVPAADGYRSSAAGFSPDGELMAIGLQNGRLAIFSLGRDLGAGPTWTGIPGAVKGLTFSSDGSRVIVATSAGLIGSYPACPECRSTRELGQEALWRFNYAQRAGLVP